MSRGRSSRAFGLEDEGRNKSGIETEVPCSLTSLGSSPWRDSFVLCMFFVLQDSRCAAPDLEAVDV